MLIDWLTLSVDITHLGERVRNHLSGLQDIILRVTPEGERVWATPARESIRSDTHAFTYIYGSSFRLMGSPARIMGDAADNVFGSLNILDNFRHMISFAEYYLRCDFPRDPKLWNCSRIDVTANYDLLSLCNVQTALNYLRHTEGGRYQVRTSAETCYWSPRSRYFSGKAYAKGPHMRYQMKKRRIFLSNEDLGLLDRLLRLELRVGSNFFTKTGLRWYELTADKLREIHAEYFGRFVGSVEVEVGDMNQVRDKIMQVAPTQSQGQQAYMTWELIKLRGVNEAKRQFKPWTWYRHIRILKTAGISWADFQAQNIVPFRRKMIVLDDPVTSWDDLRRRSA